MKQNKLFVKLTSTFCTLALLTGQVSAQLPCYGPLHQPKFPTNAEKLKMK